MTRIHRFRMIAVLVVGSALAPAFAGNVSVGQFYTELAQAKQLVSVDAVSAEANLRSAGYNLPKLSLGTSLTEGDMTSISNALGINVTTQRPAALISESQLNSYMASFGTQIRASKAGATPYETYSQGGDPGQSGNGKGKKKGHNKSPSDPR